MNKLSIIIPCYNEAENIPSFLNKISKNIPPEFEKSFELILVNNNSKDNTKEVLSKLLKKKEFSFAKTVFQPIKGYGAAISKGIENANGEFISWTHADLQANPEDVFIAFKLIKRQNNPEKCFVKGKRYGRPLFDLFFTIGMSIFETITLRKILYDINAQPNLFHKSLLKEIKEIPLDFSIDLYFYYIAKKLNYEVIRFPVYFGKRIHGQSTWNTGLKSKLKLIRRTIEFSLELKKRLKED